MKNLYAFLVVSSFVVGLLAASARPSVAYAHPAIATIVASIPAPSSASAVKENVIVLSDVRIVARRLHRAPIAKVWTCGAPRALAQGSGTVKECEYK